MAWAEKLPSGRWRGLYRDRSGRRRSAGTFTHKPKAVREAGKLESEARSARRRDPDRGLIPWDEWCERWWSSRTVEPGTLKRDASRRDVHLKPRWEGVELVEISRQDVREWAAELREEELSASTVQRCVHLLSASLSAAVDAELLDVNVAYKLKLPKGAQAVERYLTTEEYEAVRAELPEHEALIADALVGTGLRWGELAGLHRPRLDLKRRKLRVVEVWDTKTGLVKAYPKGRRLRDVPVESWLARRLAKIEPPDAATCGLPHAQGKCCGPLVFTAPEGGVLDDSNFRRVWNRACKRAGVGHVRIHDLRHTYASWLLQDGVKLEEVGELLGHVSLETTRKYAHLVKDQSHDTVRKLLDKRRGRKRRTAAKGRGAERGAA